MPGQSHESVEIGLALRASSSHGVSWGEVFNLSFFCALVSVVFAFFYEGGGRLLGLLCLPSRFSLWVAPSFSIGARHLDMSRLYDTTEWKPWKRRKRVLALVPPECHG